MTKPDIFDPTKAYGDVTPPVNGAVHYQDGGYFRPDGTLAWRDSPRTTKTVESEEIVVAVDSKGKTKTTSKKKVETVDDSLPGEPKAVLTSWLHGDLQLPPLKVIDLVKEGYGKAIGSLDEIVDFLVNELDPPLVDAKDVRVVLTKDEPQTPAKKPRAAPAKKPAASPARKAPAAKKAASKR